MTHRCLLSLIVSLSATYGHAEIGGFLKPNDPRIYLRGDGNPNELLAGIEFLSKGGNLSRADYEAAPGVILPGQSHDPFPFGGSSFLAEKPTQYSYGVLGAENSILVTGVVPTGILYSTDADLTDLEVHLGVGDGNPFSSRCVRDHPSDSIDVDFDETFFLFGSPCFEFGEFLPRDDALVRLDAIRLFSSERSITLTDYSISGDLVFDIPDFEQVSLDFAATESSTFDLIMLADEPGDYAANITLLGLDADGNEVQSPKGLAVRGSVLSPDVAGECNEDGTLDAADLMCARGEAAQLIVDALVTKPGDLDGDGMVNFADFLTLSANFGPKVWFGSRNLTSYGDGDIDLDGEVGFADFLILSANFQSAAVESVPEPRTFLQMVPLAALLFLRSRVLESCSARRRGQLRAVPDFRKSQRLHNC